MSETATVTERKTYAIGERVFYQVPMVWGQVKWFHAALKGYPIFALTPEMMLDLFAAELPALLSVLLIPVGMSQPDKVRAGEAGVRELQAHLEQTMTIEDAAPVLQDFFESGQLLTLMKKLAPGSLLKTGSTELSVS